MSRKGFKPRYKIIVAEVATQQDFYLYTWKYLWVMVSGELNVDILLIVQ